MIRMLIKVSTLVPVPTSFLPIHPIQRWKIPVPHWNSGFTALDFIFCLGGSQKFRFSTDGGWQSPSIGTSFCRRRQSNHFRRHFELSWQRSRIWQQPMSPVQSCLRSAVVLPVGPRVPMAMPADKAVVCPDYRNPNLHYCRRWKIAFLVLIRF